MAIARVVRLVGLIPAALYGWQQAPPQPVIRVNVDLVQVEAVVTDARGKRVSGLGSNEFQLLVDGKPRRISHFSFVDLGRKSTRQQPAAPQPARPPRREEVRRTVVFMVDEVHTSPDKLVMLAPVMRRFLDEQVSPGDLISVMATRNHMGIYEQFTSDPQRIRAGLDRLVRLAGQNYDQINHQDEPGMDRAGMVKTANAFFMETYHTVAMASVTRAIEALGDMPGRKAIVLFSDGIELPLEQFLSKPFQNTDPGFVFRMQQRTRQVVDLANRAGVVIYTFDAKGSMPPSGLSAQRAASLQGVPYILAKETGGLFVHDTDALSDALGRAMEDMTGYYLLGYTPEPSEVDRENLSHRIRVKVLRSGLNVRTRTGITYTPEGAPEGSGTREDLMRRALFSPFETGAIRLRLSPVYSASPPDPKTGDRRSMLRALLSIDGRDVHLQPKSDGPLTAVVDVAAVAFDANGKQVASKDQRYTIELTERQAAAFAQTSMTYQIDIPIPKPGPYEIRAAVRDSGAGTAGSAATFVDVPDFNKRRMVLSSLVLSEGNEDGGARDTKTASRDFKIGKRIHYGFQVYGATTGKPSGETKVEIELRLFRGGAQVFAGSPIPLASDPGSNELTVYGSIVVPDGFAEGEYVVQVLAHDRLAEGKASSASQGTDLTLSK